VRFGRRYQKISSCKLLGIRRQDESKEERWPR
jgi:hypothetical protein